MVAKLKGADRPTEALSVMTGTSTDSEIEPRRAWDPARDGDRRRPEALLYSPEQLLGRAPIRLRRKSDRRRLAFHVFAALGLVALTSWWVFVPHTFAGPVLLSITRHHGVHQGDLPSLAFLALAARSMWSARRILAPVGAV